MTVNLRVMLIVLMRESERCGRYVVPWREGKYRNHPIDSLYSECGNFAVLGRESEMRKLIFYIGKSDC